MPISALIPLLCSATALCGGLLTYYLAATKNRKERVALAREMTRQVRARYEAYVAMESRVARVIQEF
ncbi:MAG: hypothetical protein ACI8WY_003885, partial [Planctomycetota bacterium]